MKENEMIAELEKAFYGRSPATWGTGCVGIGDDCAVVEEGMRGELLVLKTDSVLEGVHFLRDDPPSKIGRKAVARALSDFAAMGATPRYFMATLLLSDAWKMGRLTEIYRGMGSVSREWGVRLVGGEITRSKVFGLSIAMTGKVRKKDAVMRRGAKVGDRIFVTGKLGGSFPKRHLDFMPRIREGKWLAERKFASAMMDLSDGLGKDLPELARRSGVSFRIDPAALPLNRGMSAERATNDGEDYELLFTVPLIKKKKFLEEWAFETHVTEIGECLPHDIAADWGGIRPLGYDHLDHG